MKIYLKNIVAISTILIILLTSACQPKGGDLLPILQEGSKTVSAQSKANNALQYDTEAFSIRVSGTWESLRGEISCIVVIRNLTQDKITANFNDATVTNSLNENIEILLVSTAYRNTSSETVNSKIAEIDKGQTLAFELSIGQKNDEYKGNTKYLGSEFMIKIPIMIEQEKTSTTNDYNFRFKYANYQPEGDYEDELIG